MERPVKSLEQRIKDGYKKARIRNPVVREFIAEFLGTMTLITFGDGTVAQVVLSEKMGTPLGSLFTINWGYAMAVTMGIFVAGGVSGAHINPAASVAFAVVGKLPWKKVFHYCLAQYLGAMAGSMLVYTMYYDAIYEVTHNGTEYVTPGLSGIFTTYPSAHISTGGAIFDMIIATALLLFMASAITDMKNMKLPIGLHPFCVGLAVFNIGTSFAFNCGYPLNPARDLSPRIFVALAGWGSEPFTYQDHYWILPIISCHIGGILGVLVYQFGVESHWPDTEEEEAAVEDRSTKKYAEKEAGASEEMKALTNDKNPEKA